MSAPSVPSVKNLGLRDVLHFLVAFVSTFLVTFQAGGQVWTWSALYALIPGAAVVAFRQVFPNVNVTSGELTSGVNVLKDIVSKLESNPPKATATTVSDLTTLVQQVVAAEKASTKSGVIAEVFQALGAVTAAPPAA